MTLTRDPRAPSVTQNGEPITRSHIEDKLRQIRGEVDTATTTAKPIAAAAAAVVVVGLLATAYLLGRRKGRLKSTVVEIRRV